MCNQTVGLVAAELERQGIATVALQLLRYVTERVRPPRALVVPYNHGYPLGRPGDAENQRQVLLAALQVLQEAGPGPLVREFRSDLQLS